MTVVWWLVAVAVCAGLYCAVRARIAGRGTDRFLGMVERPRGLAVSSEYAPLPDDLAQLLDVPVAAYATFIDDFVDRVREMPALLRYAHGTVALDAVVLHMDVEGGLINRISLQLNEIAAHW